MFNMDEAVSEFPDKLLRLAQSLPWPANSGIFNVLRRTFEARGRKSGKLTRIRFGSVEITVPLEHPAVYWRYRPVGLNQNFLLVAKRLLEVRSGLIIDVGANVGDGVALLRGAGIDAPILAIEGADIWFALLKSNTSTFSSVTLEQVFLGTGEQDKHLALLVKDGTAKLVKGDSSVEMTSLDSLLLRHKEHPVVLLKTDTDGFDAKVLFGAKDLLTTQKPVVFAEIDEGLLRDQGNSSQELMQYLSDCGYSSLAVWDNFGRWLTSRPISQGISDLILRYPGGLNTPYLDVAVFSKDDQSILDSLRCRLSNGK